MAPLNVQRPPSGGQSLSKVKKGPKRLKTQHEYHSSSEEEEERPHLESVELADSDNGKRFIVRVSWSPLISDRADRFCKYR